MHPLSWCDLEANNVFIGGGRSAAVNRNLLRVVVAAGCCNAETRERRCRLVLGRLRFFKDPFRALFLLRWQSVTFMGSLDLVEIHHFVICDFWLLIRRISRSFCCWCLFACRLLEPRRMELATSPHLQPNMFGMFKESLDPLRDSSFDRHMGQVIFRYILIFQNPCNTDSREFVFYAPTAAGLLATDSAKMTAVQVKAHCILILSRSTSSSRAHLGPLAKRSFYVPPLCASFRLLLCKRNYCTNINHCPIQESLPQATDGEPEEASLCWEILCISRPSRQKRRPIKGKQSLPWI